MVYSSFTRPRLSLSRTFVVKGYNFENILLLLQHYRKKNTTAMAFSHQNL